MNDLGFTYDLRKNGDVIINHNGRIAATLRGNKAKEFKEQIEPLPENDMQQLMARLTGNYKHGNERQAENHPQNR